MPAFLNKNKLKRAALGIHRLGVRQGLQLNDRKPFDSIEGHFPSSIYLEIH
jgi:hypothetical protein